MFSLLFLLPTSLALGLLPTSLSLGMLPSFLALGLLPTSLASPEVAPWLSPYSSQTAAQGYSAGTVGQAYSSGGQGYNPGSQGYNPGGQGYNPGSGGQGYNPGDPSGSSSSCFSPVAFSALRASPSSRGAPLVFQRSLTNLGGGWGRDGAHFTSPASGTYHFSWSALSGKDRELRLALKRDGQEVAASWADSAGYQTASGSVTVSLRQGDRVWLEVEEGQVYEPSHSSRGYTSLNGYRIA